MTPEALSPDEIDELLASLEAMTPEEQTQLLADLDEAERQFEVKRCRDDFLAFCHRVYPSFKEGPHHRHLKPLLHGVKDGTELRLTVSMAPRFGKSLTISFLFVCWYLGHFPAHQVMMITHTASLSEGFGRLVRNMLDSAVYHEVFPDTVVSRDKAASGNWTTTLGGVYLALGVGGSAAGKGADLLIGDDLTSEQAVLSGNPDDAFATAWEYVQVGPLQRLMPGGKIIMIGTRWGKKDPIGRALQWAEQNPGSLPWHEVRFPAIMPSGKSLWPEQWPIEELEAKRAGMQPQFWAAQYMQEPTSEEGAMIKRDWWQTWTKDEPPEIEYTICSWDTAHDTKSHNDYSACLVLGVWWHEEKNAHQIILLDAFKKRLEFPQLKQRVLENYREWKPDTLLIEKKAAGAPLIQELRQMDIVVQEVSPSRGKAGMSNDKRVRLNAISDMFHAGMVWAPETRWASEVINEVAEFPNGEHDDFVDCLSQAMARFRQGGFVRLPSDAQDDPEDRPFRRRREYY